MKIAVSSTGRTPASPVDSRFGRAPFFLIHDTKTNAWQVVENPHLQPGHGHGTGVKAAETLCKQGAQAVISGHLCAASYAALAAGGVKAYQAAGIPVSAAVAACKRGELSLLQSSEEE